MPANRERPILFSAPMVRALLDGRKTQTRRLVKLPRWATECNEDYEFELDGDPEWPHAIAKNTGCLAPIDCPHGVAGDRLWVRETWAQNWNQLSDTRMDRSFVYRADGEDRAQDNGVDLPWRPSIHMPKIASRILLEVVSVRVERLQEISADDVIEEGIEFDMHNDIRWFRHYQDISMAFRNWPDDVGSAAIQSYRTLWEQINGAGSWAANPWVWAIEFRRIK